MRIWRGVDGAATEDDLALCADGARPGALCHLDPARPAAVHDDAAHQAVGHDREVAPTPDRPQEGRRGGAPLAPPDGEVVAPETILLGAVEVVVDGPAGLAARLEERIEQRVVATRAANGELAVCPVIGVLALDMPLGVAE